MASAIELTRTKPKKPRPVKGSMGDTARSEWHAIRAIDAVRILFVLSARAAEAVAKPSETSPVAV